MNRAGSVMTDSASACFSGSDSMIVIWVTGCLSVWICGMAHLPCWPRGLASTREIPGMGSSSGASAAGWVRSRAPKPRGRKSFLCGSVLTHKLLPVGAAQHAHHRGRHRRPFTPCNAIEVHGPPRVQPFDGGTLERRWDRGGIRHHGDADVGLQQFDQIAFGCDLMAAIHVE